MPLVSSQIKRTDIAVKWSKAFLALWYSYDVSCQKRDHHLNGCTVLVQQAVEFQAILVLYYILGSLLPLVAGLHQLTRARRYAIL